MSDILTQGQGPSAENESQDDQLMGSHEAALAEDAQTTEVPTTTAVEQEEPTTAELNEQFEQPAIQTEERNVPAPPATQDRVQNQTITDIRARNKVAEPSERLNKLYQAEQNGDLVHTTGQTPNVAPDQTPTAAPLAEKKQSIWGRLFGSKEK